MNVSVTCAKFVSRCPREIHLIRRRSYQSELGLERTVFVALLAESPEVVRSLKLGNVWVFVQLIHRPRRTKISCTKIQALVDLRVETLVTGQI